MVEGPRIDESSQRRLNQEAGNSESEQQKCYSRGRPTVAVFPLPAILVGYASFMLILIFQMDFTFCELTYNISIR